MHKTCNGMWVAFESELMNTLWVSVPFLHCFENASSMNTLQRVFNVSMNSIVCERELNINLSLVRDAKGY